MKNYICWLNDMPEIYSESELLRRIYNSGNNNNGKHFEKWINILIKRGTLVEEK